MSRTRFIVLLTVVTLGVASLTLLPGSPIPYRIIAGLLGPWISPGRVAFVLNVALFVPFGVIAGHRRRPALLLAAVVASLAIEAVQFLIPGRSPDDRDLVANGAGALLGYLVVVFGDRYEPWPLSTTGPSLGTDEDPAAAGSPRARSAALRAGRSSASRRSRRGPTARTPSATTGRAARHRSPRSGSP